MTERHYATTPVARPTPGRSPAARTRGPAWHTPNVPGASSRPGPPPRRAGSRAPPAGSSVPPPGGP
ncbi:formate-dependent phosphoribosylglycinamide formyltransferase, partial [Streptomyces albidoflavus]